MHWTEESGPQAALQPLSESKQALGLLSSGGRQPASLPTYSPSSGGWELHNPLFWLLVLWIGNRSGFMHSRHGP